jgi:hypothetical protein
MSLNDSNVVDAVGFEQLSNTVVLNILDSSTWDDELSHLLALQTKLNSYFAFVESGQVYEAYPEAIGRPLRIDIIGREPLPPTAITFLEKASEIAAQLSMKIAFRFYPGSTNLEGASV